MCINTNKQYSTAERLLAVMRKEKERLGVPWYEIERKAGVGSYVTRNWLAGQCMPTIETFSRVLDALGLELCIKRRKQDRQE